MNPSSINNWLATFKHCWEKHDIEGILNLFHDSVIYYETPFKKILDKIELKKEWEYIHTQRNINLSFSIFSEKSSAYSVLWKLRYEKNNEVEIYGGTYLIKLDQNNLCTFFHHTCEKFDQ